MKNVTADQLLQSINRLDQVASLIRRLNSNGLFDTLSSSLTAVFQSEQTAGKISTEDLRYCLKKITAQIVDDIGKRADSGLSSKPTSAATTCRSDHQQFCIDYGLLESAPGTRRSTEKRRTTPQSLQSSPKPKHHKSASMAFMQPSPMNSMPTSPSRGESSLIGLSDFAIPAPSVRFNRAVRKTLEVRDLSPGPAYYSPSVTSTREHREAPTIPKGGKRYEYYVPDTPGPAFYTPLRAFLARRLKKL